MAFNNCPLCLEKQREIDRLTEEVERLKRKLRYQERQAAEERCLARRLSGSDCSQTRPGPCSVAKNRPSPPKSAVFTPLTIWMS